MQDTTVSLLDKAGEAEADGDYIGGLRFAGEVIRLSPQHDFARVKVATLLSSMAVAQGRILKDWGVNETAHTVAKEVARFMLQRGRLLLAIAACRAAMEALDGQDEDLLTILEDVHLKMATALPMPVGTPIGPLPEQVVDDGNSLLNIKNGREVYDTAVALALNPDFGVEAPNPPMPVPVLSGLSTEPFVELMKHIQLLRLPREHKIIKQGQRDASVFIIVNGEVDVYRTDGGQSEKLGTLRSGAMFGEMALILSSPRSATVQSATPVDLIELTGDSVAHVADTFPEINAELERVAGERLLLSTFGPAPLFQSLDQRQRERLVRAMTFHIVPEGEVMVEQEVEPTGLYLIVVGEVSIARDGVELATLRGGDVMGEMALVSPNQLTSASATTVDETVVFHLDHLAFDEVAEKHPELRNYLERLTDIRSREIQESMAGAPPDTTDALFI